MPDSYPQRIEAAEMALSEARAARDRHYPGSDEWKVEQGRVETVERLLVDLRLEARS